MSSVDSCPYSSIDSPVLLFVLRSSSIRPSSMLILTESRMKTKTGPNCTQHTPSKVLVAKCKIPHLKLDYWYGIIILYMCYFVFVIQTDAEQARRLRLESVSIATIRCTQDDFDLRTMTVWTRSFSILLTQTEN